MKILVNTKNAEKIQNAIGLAEGKAKERLLTFADIEKEIAYLEKFLSRRLHKKDWQGLSFTVDTNAQNFPSAYKYVPYSTHFTVLRSSGKWYVTDIERNICNQRKVYADFSEKAAELAEYASKEI